MTQERRNFIRWNKKIKVLYALADSPFVEHEMFTENISEIGMQIIAEELLQSGQKVELRLEFVYDPIPITTPAKVVYVRDQDDKHRIGLEFVEMNEFDRHRLQQYLQRIAQELVEGAPQD